MFVCVGLVGCLLVGCVLMFYVFYVLFGKAEITDATVDMQFLKD